MLSGYYSFKNQLLEFCSLKEGFLTVLCLTPFTGPTENLERIQLAEIECHMMEQTHL